MLVSDKFKFTLFADDSTLSYKFSATDDQNYVIINRELSKVHRWLLCNKILINIDKTKYLVFTYRKQMLPLPITVGDGVIQRAESIKFLGVVINDTLNFGSHIDYLPCKVSKSMGVRVTQSLKINCSKKKVLLSIYNCLKKPYFQYGIEIWGVSPNRLH